MNEESVWISRQLARSLEGKWVCRRRPSAVYNTHSLAHMQSKKHKIIWVAISRKKRFRFQMHSCKYIRPSTLSGIHETKHIYLFVYVLLSSRGTTFLYCSCLSGIVSVSSKRVVFLWLSQPVLVLLFLGLSQFMLVLCDCLSMGLPSLSRYRFS